MKKFSSVIALATCVASAGFSLDIDLGLAITASTETPNVAWGKFSGGFSAGAEAFNVFAEMSLSNQGLYGGFFGGRFGYGGMSFEFGEAGVRYEDGPILAELGRLKLHDYIETPYSLFLSGRGNVALGGAFAYDEGPFFYSSRWIALNYDLKDTDIPDRSAYLKTWGLRFGPFRFALQDANVMTNMLDLKVAEPTLERGPIFDPEYFLLPIPGIFIQYVGIRQDSPWEKRNLDDNGIVGFLLDWQEGPWYAAAQVLVDDINMNRFLDPDGRQNPDKIAWTLGGHWDGPYGKVGLYHAGATMYTFQPYGSTGVNKHYGYTFYPFTEYEVDGVPLAFEPEANYLGYLHGENNLAFMATWTHKLWGAKASSSLEFTLSGSKSPANPWHENESYLDWGEGTRLLDEAVLEKKLVLKASAAYPMGAWEFGLELMLGGVWNRLELTAGDPLDPVNGIAFYRPSNKHAVIAGVTFGGRYRLSF